MSNSPNDGEFAGFIFGVIFIIVLVCCVGLGRCTKEREIQEECDAQNGFIVTPPPPQAYVCHKK